MSAPPIKNFASVRQLGGSTREGRLHDMVTKALFRKGVRSFQVQIGVGYPRGTAIKEYFAIVKFSNGNETPAERITELDPSFLEFGIPNVHLTDEFIALCVLLQP